MAVAVKDLSSGRRAIPRLVEIVGPAGAGKTTLSQVLSQRSDQLHLANFPNVRNILNSPFFIWNALQIAPALLGLSRQNGRKLTRREFVWLSILNGWPSLLKKELKGNKIILLDQGPIFLLTDTSEFGPACLRSPKADIFWHSLFSRWAALLDTIVWLDLSDADLLERIRSRDKDHPVKNKSIEITFEFLARFRKGYTRVISNMSVHCPDLKILYFDTSQKTPQEIADQLLLEFGIAA